MSVSISSVLLYDNPLSFTFNALSLEIAASKMQLKDQINPDETAFNSFATKDLYRNAGGSATGTLAGVATVASNKLTINGSGSWGFDTTGMLGVDPNIYAHKFKYTPLISGIPGADAILFTEQTSPGVVNLTQMRHKTVSGNITIDFYDSAGVNKGTFTPLAGFSPTSGQSYDFELNVNSTTGVITLSVDGVMSASFGVTFTRSNSINLTQFGFVGFTANFDLDDYQRFSTVQHTVSFPTEIPHVAPLTAYLTTNPSALSVTTFGMQGIYSIIETATKNGSDELKYTIFFDGVDHYISGGALVISDGTYAQSNTAIEWSVTLDVIPDSLVQIRILFHSNDGTTTPTITSNTLTYVFFTPIINPSTCIIYGYLLDNSSVPTDKKITVKSSEPFFLDGNSISINELLSDENGDFSSAGYWAIKIPETVTPNIYLDVIETWVDAKGKKQIHPYKIQVLAQTSCEAEDIAS